MMLWKILVLLVKWIYRNKKGGVCMAIKSSNQITFTEHKRIVEIKEWYLATSAGTGITTETAGWTTDIQTIDYTNKYLWNYEEVVYSIGSSDISDPVIIGFYGKGEDGRGIISIVNYYQITTDMTVPSTDKLWQTKVPLLSPTNKYLWNYEIITYTDNTTTQTDPAIIGVYGDSGTAAITFEIYSVHGFMFKEDLKSIELKIAAFDGGEAITNATYTWEWWNDSLNNGDGGYSVIIQDTPEQFIIINESDEYAFASLKCTMSYNGKLYEDYAVLTNETVIYTSMVKFFDGSNIFHADDLYLVAYVELYQNNHKVETISANTYCSGVSTVSQSGVITANLNNNFVDGDKMYFIYQNNNLYEVVLGEYQSGVWSVVENVTQYTYTNSLYSTISSNIIAISKESINKAQNIDFTISKNGIDISSTHINVIDSNDPIISGNEPENPIYNQLWLDTSVTPHVLKVFEQVEGEDVVRWVECMDKIGGNVFTSKPTSYFAGDLWVLAVGEVCEQFGPGSMLKATTTSTTFDTSHWIDADAEYTELKDNIKQYFAFDPDTGLRIGQTNQKFYVNIGSTEMGFYDNSKGQNQKVVNIGNNAATIKNLTVEDNAAFNCNTTFNKQVQFYDFVWKTEINGSLSLAIAT
jgi:hypothetical protein